MDLSYSDEDNAFRAEVKSFLAQNLKPEVAEKVRLGNALAEVAARLAIAQKQAGGYWTLEQPSSSLMWLFKPSAELIAKASVFLLVIDVCMFGAPWKKGKTPF